MPEAGLTVTPVASRGDHRAFCGFPYALYHNDPHWVPPLEFSERRRWSPKHNPALRRRWVERYLARRGSRIVGRVASTIDPAFAERWAPRSGFVGFFECVDDEAGARGLLTRAESALRQRGVTRVFGPVNLTTHDEVGLLVEGFDAPPMLLSPYNPPYYETLLRHAGYAPWTDYESFGWDVDRPVSPAVERLLARVARRQGDAGGVRLRRSDPRRWNEEGRELLETYNASFRDVWGFVPLDPEEYWERAGEFRRFYRPELAIFAEAHGRVVGFALALPDINEALPAARGRLLPVGWLRLARAVPRIRSARFILLGVIPEYAGRGIGPLLAHAAAAAARELGMTHGELSLVQASNEPVRHIIEAFGGRRVKTYRLFHKQI